MKVKGATFQLPEQASTLASEVDWLYYFLFWSSVIFSIAIMGVMIYFIVKYRRKAYNDRPGVWGNHIKLELFWTFSPLIFLFALFLWGFEGYIKSAVVPANAIDVRVRGMQWNWEFEHSNGMVEKLNHLTVPVGEPVRLIMSSSDVLHSFFVPAFRVKRDVVPGMYTTLWFEAKKKGDYQVYCTEYCGAPPSIEGNVGHSNMLATIHVVGREAYNKLLKEGPAMPEGLTPAQWGALLYKEYSCTTCHHVDGKSMQPAPNFKGLWGRKEVFTDGSSLIADENYIKESILQPQAKIVKGYNKVIMPPFRMPDKQIDAIIAYIRSLGETK